MPDDSRNTSLDRLKVLLAEDNPVNQLYITKTLEKQGVEVVTVANGRKVLAALEEHRDVDLVLMDISMPGLDGLEATARIRASDPERIDPHLPIIALTAHAMKGDRENFLGQGLDGYLSKPVKPQELFDTVRRLARKRD